MDFTKDKYSKNTYVIMNDIDFDKFYNEFDLEDFLLEPIGKFNREDIKEIIGSVTNLNGVATMAGFYGFNKALAKEIEQASTNSDLQDKARHLLSNEAIEIYSRLLLVKRLKNWSDKINDESL